MAHTRTPLSWPSARRAALSACVMGAALGSAGCILPPKIHVTKRNEDRPVRSYEEVTVPTAWKPVGSAAVDRGSDGQPDRVRLDVLRTKHCTRTRHHLVDRTVIEERRVDDMRIAGYTLGGIGAGLLGGGVALAAADRGGDLATGMIVWGVFLTPALVTAVVQELRAIDDHDHVGIVDEPVVEQLPDCRREPFAHAAVQIVPAQGDGVLLEGTLDAEGRLDAPIDLDRALALGPDYLVKIDGEVLVRIRIEVSGAVQAR